MAALAQLSNECHQSIKVHIVNSLERIDYSNSLQLNISTTAIALRSRLTELRIPGGTTEMETRDIFGREAMQVSTLVSVELITTVLKLL